VSVSPFLIEYAWTSVAQNPVEVLKSLMVKEILHLMQNDFRISMGSNVVPTNSVMDIFKVHTVVKQHGGSHVNGLIVDFLLNLPIRVWFTRGGGGSNQCLLLSLVFFSQTSDTWHGIKKVGHVIQGKKMLLQDMQDDMWKNALSC
jgi:hypothetical protein